MKKIFGFCLSLVFCFICSVGLFSNPAFADVFSGSQSNSFTTGSCSSPHCMDGKLWVHYEYINGATQAQIGGVPGELRRDEDGNNNPYISPVNIPDTDGLCTTKGDGVWVLQQTTYSYYGLDVTLGFGLVRIHEPYSSGSSINYVSRDLDGIIDAGCSTYNNFKLGDLSLSFNGTGLANLLNDSGSKLNYACTHASESGSYPNASKVILLDTSKVKPDGLTLNSDDAAKEKYCSYNLGGGQSCDDAWTSFLNQAGGQGGSWFCGGGSSVVDEDKVAKFEGKVVASVVDSALRKVDGETYGGYQVYNGYGVSASISTPAQGIAKMKRLSDDGVPDSLATKYKFVAESIPPDSLGADALSSSPFSSGSGFSDLSPFLKPSGGTATLGITESPELRCFSMRYNDTISFTGSGSSWSETGRTTATAKDCIAVKNYNAVEANFSGSSSGAWKENLGAKVPLDRSSPTNASMRYVIYGADGKPELDSDGEPKNYFDDSGISEVEYEYHFDHSISLDNLAALSDFFGKGYSIGANSKIEYKIYQKIDDGTEEEIESNSHAVNSGTLADYAIPIPKDGTVLIPKPDEGGNNAHRVCQRLELTQVISYATTASGVSVTPSALSTASEACIYLGGQYVVPAPEPLADGEIMIRGDTLQVDFNADGFDAGGVYKMLSPVMEGRMSHSMVLDLSGLTFYEDDSSNDPPFKGTNSLKNATFESDYVGLAELNGLDPVALSPRGGSGGSIAPAPITPVVGYRVGFQATSLKSASEYAYNMVSGGSGSYNADPSSRWEASLGSNGSTSVSIGYKPGGSQDLYLLAGEDKELSVLTYNKPAKWLAKYNSVGLTTTTSSIDPSTGATNSSSSTSAPFKVEYVGVEKDDDSDYTSDNIKNIKVHRDYNFKIQNFKLANVEGPDAFGGDSQTVVAGEHATIPFTFDIVRHEGSHKSGAVNNWRDDQSRNYLTDVFADNTKAHLIGFELVPGVDNNVIRSLVNGLGSDSYDNPVEKSLDELEDEIKNIVGSGNVDLFDHKSIDPFTDAETPFGSVTVRGNGVYDLTERSGLRFSANVEVSSQVAVGGKYCFGIFVTSITNDEIKGTDEPNGSWLLSEIACANVVKKPSMEVWGGDVASNGGIQTSTTRTEISPAGAYGSWGDFGIIANEKITGMSSGRSLKANGRDQSQIGLNSLSPLTIANRGRFGEAKIDGLDDSIFEELKSRYNCETYPCTMSNGVRVTNNLGELYGSSITDRIVLVYDSGLTIADNIILDSDNGGTRYGNESGAEKTIPQVLIISEGSVTIADNVDRIDAWIVSKREVDTCSGAEVGNGGAPVSGKTYVGLENCGYGSVLEIDGPIIGSQLLFERTYGENVNECRYVGGSRDCTTFSPSLGESAEEIDFSPAAILFGVQESSDAAPRTTYIKKLAPRY